MLSESIALLKSKVSPNTIGSVVLSREEVLGLVGSLEEMQRTLANYLLQGADELAEAKSRIRVLKGYVESLLASADDINATDEEISAKVDQAICETMKR